MKRIHNFFLIKIGEILFFGQHYFIFFCIGGAAPPISLVLVGGFAALNTPPGAPPSGPECFGTETQATGSEVLLVNVSESDPQKCLSPNPK